MNWQAMVLILWSTSYLDEAEQCRDILLLNQGQLLYRGIPQALTNKMAGRSFLLQVPASNRRAYLQDALLLPQTTDCVIQGHCIRLILKQNSQQTDFLASLNLADSKLITAKRRFEDAFIDLLGGSPSHVLSLRKLCRKFQLIQLKPSLRHKILAIWRKNFHCTVI